MRLLDRLDPLLTGEPAVALATLIAATGSSSKRKIGAPMVVGHRLFFDRRAPRLPLETLRRSVASLRAVTL